MSFESPNARCITTEYSLLFKKDSLNYDIIIPIWKKVKMRPREMKWFVHCLGKK